MKSIMQENDRCYLCRMAFGTETHHVFPGNPNRKHSEEDGLTVRLCLNCHWKVHFDSKDDGESMLKLKRDGQEAWERCYWKGDEETTRSAFIERYGRSVL